MRRSLGRPLANRCAPPDPSDGGPGRADDDGLDGAGDGAAGGASGVGVAGDAGGGSSEVGSMRPV